MKTMHVLSLAVSLLVGASTLQGVVLQSFENAGYTPTFYYGGGNWVGSPSSVGFSITSGTASSANGFGQDVGPFDLSAQEDLAVTIKLLPGNQATFINVLLRTGTTGTTNANYYTIPTSNFNESTFTTYTVALSAYNFQGGSGAVLSNIDRIQIQGSGSNVATDNVRFQIQTVAATAVPEAGQSALIFGAIVFGWMVMRRIRRK